MKSTILLQDQNYQLGIDIALSIGCNLKGKNVITKSIICLNPSGNLYCTNGGIRIKLNEEDLKEYYTNTPENLKLLKKLLA